MALESGGLQETDHLVLSIAYKAGKARQGRVCYGWVWCGWGMVRQVGRGLVSLGRVRPGALWRFEAWHGRQGEVCYGRSSPGSVR